MPVLDAIDRHKDADDERDHALRSLNPQQQPALLHAIGQHTASGCEQQHRHARGEGDQAKGGRRTGDRKGEVAVGHHLHLHDQGVGLVAVPVRAIVLVFAQCAEQALQSRLTNCWGRGLSYRRDHQHTIGS